MDVPVVATCGTYGCQFLLEWGLLTPQHISGTEHEHGVEVTGHMECTSKHDTTGLESMYLKEVCGQSRSLLRFEHPEFATAVETRRRVRVLFSPFWHTSSQMSVCLVA